MAQPVDTSLSVLGCPPALATELTRALLTGNTTTARIISGCGVAGGPATEIATQVNARTGNAANLVNCGFSAPLASVMAAQITAGPA